MNISIKLNESWSTHLRYFFAFTGLFKCLFIKLLWLEANKRRKGVSPIVEDVLTTYRHKSKEKYNFHELLLDKSVNSRSSRNKLRWYVKTYLNLSALQQKDISLLNWVATWYENAPKDELKLKLLFEGTGLSEWHMAC